MTNSYQSHDFSRRLRMVIESYVWNKLLMCVSWLIHVCALSHLFVCHDSFMCAPWRIHTYFMTHSYTCHDSFTWVPWLIHMCAMTHLCVCHASFIHVPWLNSCVPRLLHMYAMNNLHVRYDLLIHDTIFAGWFVHICDITHLCVWYYSFACMPWLMHTCAILYVAFVCDMNHSYET